jgi:hypothetical protein
LDELDKFYRLNVKKQTIEIDSSQRKYLSNESEKSKERIEAERLVESREYSEDPEVNKLMYKLYQDQLKLKALPSDKRDIRTH